jgi:hypothetical protein
MPYKPQPESDTASRIAALRAILGSDVDEIAATLVDEDEAAFPGGWAAVGFDRMSAISEYLYELGEIA